VSYRGKRRGVVDEYAFEIARWLRRDPRWAPIPSPAEFRSIVRDQASRLLIDQASPVLPDPGSQLAAGLWHRYSGRRPDSELRRPARARPIWRKRVIAQAKLG